jgi:predicted transcriptional regulator YheO
MEDQLHGTNPIEAILGRASENSETRESQTLVKAVLSVIRNQDDVSVGELCALSTEALDLLHAFVQECMAGRYERSFLDGVAASLVSRQGRSFRPILRAA